MSLQALLGPRPKSRSYPRISPLSFLLALTSVPLMSAQILTTTTASSEPTSTDAASAATSTEGSDGNGNPNSHSAFNFYFLIIAVFVLFVLSTFVYNSRRRKAKILARRHSAHAALSQDVSAFPAAAQSGGRRVPGFGNGRFAAGRWANTWRARDVREEGLDERGEAPPAYDAEGKPPSISEIHMRESATNGREPDVERGEGPSSSGRRTSVSDDLGLAVPMRTLSRSGNGRAPPTYDTSEEDLDVSMRRPAVQERTFAR
jgi:hypothetical protein